MSAQALRAGAAASAPLTAEDAPGIPQALQWQPLRTIEFSDRAAIAKARDAGEPVIIDGLAQDWPALARWTPEHLAERYGDREVPVYDASFGEPGARYMGSIDRMPFAQFLRATQIEGRDLRMFLYNLAQQIPALLNDVHLPSMGLRFSRRFVFSFFGCQGSTTPLHYDIDMADVCHTVIRGRRRIRLFAPTDAAALYRHPCTVRSYVNLDRPDLDRYPALAHARGFEAVLAPGQTLYMPAGWWHEFHYLDAGIGVSLRAAPSRWRDRVRSVGQLAITMPLDRLANRIAPDRWFAWKTAAADRAAARFAASAPRSNGTPGQADR
ncbi:MAG: cupin-like domain-containing protein [Pseudomonadota bacterium]